MKQQFKTVVLTLAVVALAFSMASAQILPLNNFGISPPGGPFDPTGKFTSIGESGGVPGPTSDGCDLYGFRSQVDTFTAISLGVQTFGAFNFPALVFEANGTIPFLISEQTPSDSTGGVPGIGCGAVLALYSSGAGGPAPEDNYVYNIFGSAFASNGVWAASDKNLKRKIKPIKNAMEIVEKLNGVTYEYRRDERPELRLNGGRQYGFITQEVEEVMPEAVATPPGIDGKPADFQAMNYDMIIPVLTEAIKIQQEEIKLQESVNEEQKVINERLEERIAALEAQLLKMSGSQSLDAGSIDASDITLKQNRPNPSTGLTTIEYSLPASLNNAQLTIYDTNGRLVSRQNIAAGNGSIDVSTNAFAAGVYFYAVEVNGQSLARQKMVIK